jgi:hypothetical protein
MTTSKEIKNGSRVTFRDDPGEVFVVSQWDEGRQHGWVGDKDGRGWYAYASQLIVVGSDEDEDE